ncbi:MAG: GrpB family protein [Candidatus Dormiibacterota bacterium]
MGREGAEAEPLSDANELAAELAARLGQLGYAEWSGGPHQPTAWQVWAELYARFGRRITLIDLYQLEALARGVRVADLPEADRDRMAIQVLPVQFPDWTRNARPVGPHEPIEVVAYDPQWPALYASWKHRLWEALAESPLRVDHVGSTAVPDLAAKPVIDIQVSVQQLQDEARYVPQLEALGIPLRTRDSMRRFCCPPPGSPRTVQVHVCQADSVWEREHLLYRDYLRAQPEVRRHYGELKQELAKLWRNDRMAYTDAKTGFILDALIDAENWAAATGWRLTAAGH